MELTLVENLSRVLERMNSLGMVFGDPQKVDLILGLFFDVKCSACARMFTECEDYIFDLVNSGKACVYYLDFPVHKGSESIHVALRCLYKESPRMFIDALRRCYERLKKGAHEKEVELERISCPDVSVDTVMECKRFGREIGVRGTPTLLVGLRSRNVGVLLEGYMGRSATIRFVERALNKDSEFDKLITLLLLIGQEERRSKGQDASGAKA